MMIVSGAADGVVTLIDSDHPERNRTLGQVTADKLYAAVAQFRADYPDAVERGLIPKYVIVDRLQAAGKLEAARAALDAADLYTRERWNNRDAIYSDDPTAIALLQAIGANVADILASE